MKKIISIFLLSLIIIPSLFVLKQVEAVTPTIIVNRESEQGGNVPYYGITKELFKWSFSIKTTDVPNDTKIIINTYKNGTKEGEQKIEKILNKEAIFITEQVLEKGVIYKITFEITNPKISAEYSAKVGDNTSENIVYVTPQKDTPPESTYKLLAPIGNMENAPEKVGTYLNIMIGIAIGLCAALAVIMIIIGGIMYMGSESIFGKTEAKGQITKAILGLLIALGAYALLNTINPDFLNNELSVSAVSALIEEELNPWESYEAGDNINACPGGFKDVPTGGSPANINVCGSISIKLSEMIAAAKKDGINLSGFGSRSIASQRQKRAQNCGGTANIDKKDAVCNPKTAIPGNSNHEKGLAVDFRCNGLPIGKTDTSNICYQWLVKNAKDYGFFNNYKLIQETWHWSTTGT